MIPRVLEPEVMDTAQDAADYDAMDHAQVNCAFVDDFLDAMAAGSLASRFDDSARPLEILDVGTGTAQIPIALCRKLTTCHVTAVDLSAEMLTIGQRNVSAASLERCIHLERIDAKHLPYPNQHFDAVISNSIAHHIPDPRGAFREMVRVTRSGGLVFVRDLLRPDDRDTLESLVVTYCGNENKHQQQLFRDSLHASLTLEEIHEILLEIGVLSAQVQQSSDRHWTFISAV